MCALVMNVQCIILCVWIFKASEDEYTMMS